MNFVPHVAMRQMMVQLPGTFILYFKLINVLINAF